MITTSESPAPAAPTRLGPSTPPQLDLRAHLAALRRFWKSILLLTLLGVLVAVGLTLTAQKTYETRLTFFVATPTSGANLSPLQADEYAQRRVNSYVGVANSDQMAAVVLSDTGLPLTVADVGKMISASVEPDTVLMNVVVTDKSPDNSLLVAQSLARKLNGQVRQLDGGRSDTAVALRVITGPTLDPAAVSPRTRLNLGLGLLLGLAAGLAQALLRQQFDTTVRGRERLTEVTGLPTLGLIHDDRRARKAPVGTPQGRGSRRAEDFRQLRTNLRFVDAAGAVEVLVVTSSMPAEGKTSTAANLAQSFAAAGRRVLLVDADLRGTKLQRYLGLKSSTGLAGVLAGEAKLADAVQEWGPDRLSVLTSGAIPSNPSELLGSPAMEALVQQARHDYDLVVIDTPAVLPVTDAAVTAVLADGVLLQVRYGKTRRPQVQQALEALEVVNARVLGTVLSMTPNVRGDKLPRSSGTNATAPARNS